MPVWNLSASRVAPATASTFAWLILCASAPANPQIRNEWLGTYPPESYNSGSCNLCHVFGSNEPWNPYGWHIRTSLGKGLSVAEAFAAAEDVDSDQDPTGSTNLDEIVAGAQPGWTEGPNNTYFFEDESTETNQPPAFVLGDLDPAPACDEDLDGSGDVGFSDLTALLSAWGPCPAPPAECPADFDGSGDVGFADLTQLLSAWGNCI
jgi:hypothetical protein